MRKMELVVAVMMMMVGPETMIPLHPSLFPETPTSQWHNHQAGGLGFLEDAWLELHQDSGCQRHGGLEGWLVGWWTVVWMQCDLKVV